MSTILNKQAGHRPDPPENRGSVGQADRTDRIRSFVLRAGRLTAGQQRALDDLSPHFLIPFQNQPFDWMAAFPHSSTGNACGARPRILEIGFGMGETTATIAQLRPQDDFLAIEVHLPGVGALLKRIGELGLTNLRLIRHDAVEVLEHMIEANSLDGIHIYFADPWHKKRHHKRRLIQKQFVELLASRINSGGYLHLATDWHNYAEQMLLVLNRQASLQNTSFEHVRIETFSRADVVADDLADDANVVKNEFTLTLGDLEGEHHGYVNRPSYRPITKFENRGIRLGHGVWDLVYRKR
jgi:tRNA (guanine-N7-)-methyltransferase